MPTDGDIRQRHAALSEIMMNKLMSIIAIAAILSVALAGAKQAPANEGGPEKHANSENSHPPAWTDNTRWASLQRHFFLGSHLAREPMPSMDELKRDMETLKRNGFNLVKLQEQWAVDEPEEGQFDFSKYEELIGHAKSLGMYVYLGITCEQAPA